MKYAIIATLCLVSLSVSAEGIDEVYSKVNGSCTEKSCPPGSSVKVTASKDDTSDAIGSDGKTYPLLGLIGIKMRVVKQDDNCVSCSVVAVPGGMTYSIDRPFLKRAN